jgi:hypothetical protein
MTTFDDREKAFEAKFRLDQDAQFKVNNRANRLLGLWVASEIGKSGADADAYAKRRFAASSASSRARPRSR